MGPSQEALEPSHGRLEACMSDSPRNGGWAIEQCQSRTAYAIETVERCRPLVKGLAVVLPAIALQAALALPGHAAETLPADVLRSWLVRFHPCLRRVL